MISKLYKHQDNLYKILREIKISSFEKGGLDLVKEFRDYLGADHVLQTQTHFMFCETIQDAEIIEEIID